MGHMNKMIVMNAQKLDSNRVLEQTEQKLRRIEAKGKSQKSLQ